MESPDECEGGAEGNVVLHDEKDGILLVVRLNDVWPVRYGKSMASLKVGGTEPFPEPP